MMQLNQCTFPLRRPLEQKYVTMTIGQRIKRLREEAGLTQQALGKAVGVSRNAVGQWESGDTRPKIENLHAISRALNCHSIDDLIGPGEQQRARIIDAAFRHFDQVGFSETPIEALCADARIDKKAFHSFFETKEDLLFELIEIFNQRTFETLERVPPEYGSLDVRVKHLLHTYYAHDLDHIRLTATFHAYSWQWGPERERRNRQQLSRHHDLLCNVFQDSVTLAEIPQGDFRNASQLLLSAYTYALREAVFQEMTARRLVNTLTPQIDIVLAGLGFRAAHSERHDSA